MIRFVLVCLCLVVAGSLLVLPSVPNSAAQGDATPTTTTTLHVVQRGETLSDIALLYNTSVDAIMTMNGIDDARFIDVGQRLLIPEASALQPGTNFVHTVTVGDGLYQVAAQFAVPPSQIIAQNGVLHPGRLHIGQELIVGEIGGRNNDYGTYEVQAADTLLTVAARFGMTTSELVSINGLSSELPLITGQRVIVRGGEPNLLPAPFTTMTLTPEVPIQGQSVGLRFRLATDVQIDGQFMGRPFEVIRGENGEHQTVLGVHSLSVPGVYPIQMTFTTTANIRSQHEIRLRVADGGYGSEAITIPPDRTNLLEPTLVQSELDQVAAVMSGFAPQQRFAGLMALPSTGPVTSQYGTRRSYNGSPIDNNFHGGADFGGSIGAPITAPSDAVVAFARPLQVRGNVVILDHGWGVYTGYWHLSEILVIEGQSLSRGEVLGAMGNTGLVTGTHLHWEMWVQGVQVDPMQWVQQSFP